uniref:DH domain-containing protein n=1 Tax=Arcella intermedia TaxID=1963864 RepID=A0A6B2LAP2_9EUKA
MEDAMNKYYAPMLLEADTDPTISKELVEKIFGNIKQITPINREHLYEDLQVRVSNWTPTTEIGDLFVNFAHLLKMYTVYSNGYDTAMKNLEIVATQPWFFKFCPAKVIIESILIMPIQRIPRYMLLLTDLYRNTPEDHPDDMNLARALKNIKNTAAHVNEGVAKHKNFDKLTSEGLTFLLAAHRTLVVDEVLSVVSFEEKRSRRGKEGLRKPGKSGKDGTNYKFMLFNDILVIMDSVAMKKRIKEPKDIEQWPVELLWVERGVDTSIKITGPYGGNLWSKLWINNWKIHKFT